MTEHSNLNCKSNYLTKIFSSKIFLLDTVKINCSFILHGVLKIMTLTQSILMIVETICENIFNTIHIGYQTFIKLANIHYKIIQGHTETISFELVVNLNIS